MNNAGRIGFDIKGEYSPTVTYDFLDVVFYQKSSYVAKKLTVGNTPARSDEYWQILAEAEGITADGDISETTVTFTEAANRENVASGETSATLFGKIRRVISDLKTVAFSGKYSDLSGAPGIMTGATASAVGTSGLVPAPGAGKQEAVLQGGGTWKNLGAAAFMGVANNDATEEEGFLWDARRGKAMRDDLELLNSASKTVESNISSLTGKMKNLTTVYISTGQATSNHAQCIQDSWTSFPDDMPFIGIITDNSQVFILGYMYGNRQYGCIMYLSYYTGQGMVIRSNGNFSFKEL